MENTVKQNSSAQCSPRLITAKEVAAIISCSPKTVYSWAELGQIPCIKLGSGRKSLLRFSRQEIYAWIEAWQRKSNKRYNASNAETVAGAQGRRI